MDKISIIGCGGHSRSVADVLIHTNPNIDIVFYDENAQKNEYIFRDYRVIELSESTVFENNIIFVAVGDNTKRKRLVDSFISQYDYISIISGCSYVSKYSTIKQGVFLGDGAHIGPEAIIGEFTIINTNAVIEHEVKIGSFCHISVNTTICGGCKLGDNVFVGAGAVIKDKINVCSDVTIGAGTVVIEDIIEIGVYVGCPARKIK